MQNTFQATSTIQSATQRVYLRLRKDIIEGVIPPGERLKVDILKVRLETGASPVREALSLLTSDQLVERLDQRGFRVAAVGQEQFNEILNLRCTLEDVALRQSIANSDQNWEEMLVLSHHHLIRAEGTDNETIDELHKDFHMALISACASPILFKFCGQLYDLNVRYRHLAGKSKAYGQRNVAAEHMAILNAALDRDADSASEKLMDHYRKTGAFLSDQFS